LENIQKNPEKCRLAGWLKTEQAEKAYSEGDAEFRKAWEALADSRTRMHRCLESKNCTGRLVPGGVCLPAGGNRTGPPAKN
jgi:hypothetical protein